MYFKFHICFYFFKVAMIKAAENCFLCKLKFHPEESISILFPGKISSDISFFLMNNFLETVI